MAKTGKRQPPVNGATGRRAAAGPPMDALVEPVMGARGTSYGVSGPHATDPERDPAADRAEADRLRAEESELAESLLADAHLNDPFLDGRTLPDSYLGTNGLRDTTHRDPTPRDPTPRDPTERDPTDRDPTDRDSAAGDPYRNDPYGAESYLNDSYRGQTYDSDLYGGPGGRDPYAEPLVGGFSLDELRAALNAAERPADADQGWSRTLRRLAQFAVWALPLSAIVLAVSAAWGWPTAASEGGAMSPGTWLVFTLLGLALALIGALAMTALLTATNSAPWALAGLGLVLAGTVSLAPLLGVIGVARPAVTRLASPLGPDLHAELESRFFGGAVTRWLGVGGLVLLAAGWLAIACAVLGSDVLNKLDGALLAGAVAMAGAAAYTHWQFLLVIAAMLALAAGLGLSWTASRLTPNGVPPLD